MRSSPHRPDVPPVLVEAWQRALDVLADMLDLEASFLLTVGDSGFELTASGGPAVAFASPRGDVPEAVSRFAEAVLQEGGRLEAPAADHPGISYVGLPVAWPDGEALGCICAADGRGRTRTGKGRDLLDLCRETIEKDLRGVRETVDLRSERDTLSRILDSMVDGAYVAGPDRELVYVNAALESALGPPGGRPCSEYLLGVDGPCAWCDHAHVARGETLRGEWTHPELGRTFEVVNTAIPLGDGRPGVLGILRDVSEAREGEEQRRRDEQSRHLAQKLESLRVLAGGVAHDYNNLLFVILGSADLARCVLEPHSPARPHLDEIASCSRRAAILTRQMLDFSGRGRCLLEPVELGGLVRGMEKRIEEVIPRETRLRLVLADELPTIHVDAGQIRQLVLNLVTNAAEALEDGPGTVTIECGRMDCDRAYLESTCTACRVGRRDPPTEGPYAYVEVADTGSGMDRDTCRRIFDPFFTTRFPGRGLGMAAVLGIVRGHGGVIRITSEPGRGTAVRIGLPLAEAL